MRVLVACEFSGVVRRAFRWAGHIAWSCDLLPAEDGAYHHIVGDVRNHLHGLANPVNATEPWDLLIAHPPCTHLAVSGARWFSKKEREQDAALDFVRELMLAPIPRICVENPVSIISSRIRKPDQIIQPWQFGHPETKATCFWLKNLPQLKPRNPLPRKPAPLLNDSVVPVIARVHREPPGPDRWKNRSRTLQGIADAMAEQWGVLDSRAEPRAAAPEILDSIALNPSAAAQGEEK